MSFKGFQMEAFFILKVARAPIFLTLKLPILMRDLQ
jgi:hypothetical protein